MTIIAILVNVLCVYIIIGTIMSMIASIKSKKREFYDNEVIILGKIVIMWAWKYKALVKKLND